LAKPAVLDASALLALLYREPGSGILAPVLPDALLSTATLAEVHARLLLKGVDAGFAWSRLLALACEVCPLTAEQARRVGELLPQSEFSGLSMGTLAALALAEERRATVYTADTACKRLPLNVEIVVLG
jgi:PIN domain nuclease of toxin-antitoxin system